MREPQPPLGYRVLRTGTRSYEHTPHDTYHTDGGIIGYGKRRRVNWPKIRAWIAALGLFMSGAAFGAWCVMPHDKLLLGLSALALALFFWSADTEAHRTAR